MSLLQTEKKPFSIVAHRDNRLSPALHLIKEFLTLGYSVRFRAKGTSMTPTIRDREVITVSPVKPSDLRLHDIILYQNNRTLIAHRVVRRQRTKSDLTFITRGDALGCCDDPVKPQEILGKVMSVDRNGRSIGLDNRCSKVFYTVHLALLFLKRKMYRSVKALRFVNTGKA